MTPIQVPMIAISLIAGMQQDEKPRARIYSHKSSCVAWMCEGKKNGKYHVVFSGSWWEACRRWHATKPIHEFSDDIPF